MKNPRLRLGIICPQPARREFVRSRLYKECFSEGIKNEIKLVQNTKQYY